MLFANDSYEITAADAAALVYVGRAWDARTRQYTTVTDITLIPGISTPDLFYLKSLDLRILTAARGIKSGIRAMLMTIPDAQHPGDVIVVKEGIQSACQTINWHGEVFLGAGLQWRIHLGALIATDIVTLSAGYEVRR